jgi:Transglycosylase SLT domain/SPOR domain
MRMLCYAALGLWLGHVASALAAPGSRAGETVGQALCRLIETSARARALPVPFLTRLIWQESSFRTTAVSRAGAQGVAQFMPGTAQERGLADPFDPEQAIPAAAHLLSDLRAQFGNLGLAAAAYNGGPHRVAAWLAGHGGLPAETRDYVIRITGRPAEDWRGDPETRGDAASSDEPPQSCLQLTASLKSLRGPASGVVREGPLAPWGVQLAGNFSKTIALASFARARQAYNVILGDAQPMVIGTRLRTRGSRTYYRVRVGAATRQAANALCNRIRAIRGACIVLPS